MTPDVCDPEDFSQDRFVAVRAPGVGHVEFAYLSDVGDVIQVDPSPRRRAGDVFETRTQQFADTARHHPTGRMVAKLHTDGGHFEVTALFARPRLLASGVSLAGTYWSSVMSRRWKIWQSTSGTRQRHGEPPKHSRTGRASGVAREVHRKR